ncbi:MAG: mandelate racemase/muconate lactonizing enzyme family protein [Thermoleophilia bacterium]|nr:mandelate racemase/muconate lactonizing enzyme family protein [Thermoleophilia bacterium]
MSEIVDVAAIPLRAGRDARDLDSSAETVVVRVTDDEGRTGIGEADAPALAVRELVLMEGVHAWSRGLREVLLGRDALDLSSLWEEMYEATIYHGRRGLGIHALSAVDVALHDLAGKTLARPVYELLGGPRRERIHPYATVWPGTPKGRTLAELMDATSALLEGAVAAGFRAVKMEVVFGEAARDEELVECVREGRRVLGADVVLMLDFGYRWRDWRAAYTVLAEIEDCDVFFAEATLHHDEVDGHRELSERCELRIAGAELAATVHECREWLERGRVDVLQPDIGRAGGFTEMRRIAALADEHGALVVPHGWKTGITVAASCHFQAASENVPYVELLSPLLFDSPLRRELVRPEPRIEAGTLPLPPGPGLGIELVAEALARYSVAV